MSQSTSARIEPTFGIVPHNIIRPSTTNRKNFNQVKLNELAESIKQFGIQQPIIVRPIEAAEDSAVVFEIVAGERRWRAAGIAGLETVPVIVRHLTDAEARQIQTIENLQREDLHPLEEAEGFDQLMKLDGFTAEELGEKVGKSKAYVYAKLKLLALAPEARQAFMDSKLPASTALLIARIPVASLQLKAAHEIIHWNGGMHQMPVRMAASHIQTRYMLNLEDAPFSTEDAKLVPSAGACVACPKRTGNQPEIFADIAGTDVCTDPDCFASKRLALNNKMLAKASKKGIPIHDGGTNFYQAFAKIDDDNLVSPFNRIYEFEHVKQETHGSKYYQTIDQALPVELRPEPVHVIKMDSGEVHHVFTKTAIQTALEKAGLCLTLEEHMRQTNEKLREEEADPETLARQKKRADEQAAELNEVKQETDFRVALYRRIRLFASEALTSRMFRSIVKHIINSGYHEWELPERELSDLYNFSTETTEDIEAHIDSAPHSEVELLLMDMAVGPCLSIYGRYDPEDDEDDSSYQLLMRLAGHAGIDLDALRVELAPAPIQETAPDPEPVKKAKGTKGAKVMAPTESVMTTGAVQDATATEDARLAAWPFPTAERIAELQATAASVAIAPDEVRP